MDLIDRQQAIDAIEFGITYARAFNKETGEVKELFQEGNHELRKAVERIKQLPSAQPEIIHCKDCKYGILDSSFPHQWFCKFKGDEWNNGDYFCGHARKREVAT